MDWYNEFWYGKKGKAEKCGSGELFIALIVHESSPDYDVSMQLLQYSAADG